MEAKNIITNSEFKERKSYLCLLTSTKNVIVPWFNPYIF